LVPDTGGTPVLTSCTQHAPRPSGHVYCDVDMDGVHHNPRTCTCVTDPLSCELEGHRIAARQRALQEEERESMSVAAASAPAVALEIRHLPLDDIKPSPENPRRHFDVEGLNELAASLRVHGVLEPILVRPVDLRDWEAKLAAGKKVPMEIVAGERRWRAAAIA